MTPERPYGLAWWRARALMRVHDGIAWYLPRAVSRAVRHDLAGVWGVEEAALPDAGAVLVANHHSWWDGYLAWLLARRHGRPFAVLVDEATLVRYPFFRRLGALATSELRTAVRRASAGAWLFVFPEGRLLAPAAPGPFASGAATIARLAQVPVVPCAWRVVVRGAQYPEVYVRCGAVLARSAQPDEQRAAVARLLARIERDLADADDAEAPLPGYDSWYPGRSSTQARVQRWRRWWGAA